MKIRVTHEVTDQQRLAIQAALDGEFKLATRETLEGWIFNTIETELGEMDKAFGEAKDALLKRLNI